MRQQNKSAQLSGTLAIQLFCFFFHTECLSVYIWISTRAVTQLSGERRSRNIQPNNSPWQLPHFLFYFLFVCLLFFFFPPKLDTGCVFCAVNSRAVSLHVKGLVLCSLIEPTWQLFGPNWICWCWFWSRPYWEWFESISASPESIMNLLHLFYGEDWVALIICLQSYAAEKSDTDVSLDCILHQIYQSFLLSLLSLSPKSIPLYILNPVKHLSVFWHVLLPLPIRHMKSSLAYQLVTFTPINLP